jgi:hypothetical protein
MGESGCGRRGVDGSEQLLPGGFGVPLLRQVGRQTRSFGLTSAHAPVSRPNKIIQEADYCLSVTRAVFTDSLFNQWLTF